MIESETQEDALVEASEPVEDPPDAPPL